MCVPYSQTSCHSPLLQDDFGHVWGVPEQRAPVHSSTSWGGWWGKGMGTGLFLARGDPTLLAGLGDPGWTGGLGGEVAHGPVEVPDQGSQGLVVEARQAMNELLVPLQALGLRGDFWREVNESWTIAESAGHRADMAPGVLLGPCPEGRQPPSSPVWEQALGEGGTCSLLPLWVQLQGEDGVLELTEEPLQHVGDVLDKVVIDAQLDVAGIPPELLHQYLDPGLGSVLAVNALVPQPWRGDMGSHEGPILARESPAGLVPQE